MPTQAQIDEAKKIRLEKIVIPEIRSLFNRMNKENAQSIAATGMPVVASKYRGDWEALLRKHYVRVQDNFFRDIEKTLDESDQGFSDEEMAILLIALIAWRDQRARNSAQIITNTNDRQISESVKQSRELFTEQNERAPSNRELALGAAAIFRRKYKPRSAGIATTETQASAENAKFSEASVLSGENPADVSRPGARVVSKSIKRWGTVGDNLVRDLHVVLNGVKKLLNEAFEGGGERLLHPGDTSLGATAKMIFNCRCGLDYIIERVRR